MKAYIKKNLFNIISMVLSASVLLYFCLTNDGMRDLIRDSSSLNGYWLLIACGCMLIFWLLDSAALHVLIKRLYKKHKFKYTIKESMTGQLYSALTPFSSGGQPMQLMQMTRDGLEAGPAGSVLALKSIIYQVGLTGFSIVSLIFYFSYLNERITHFGPLAIIGLFVNIMVITVMITFSYTPKLTKRVMSFFVGVLHKIRLVKNKEETITRAEEHLQQFHEGTKLFAKSKGMYVKAILLTVLQFIFYFSIPYCIYRCFNMSGSVLLVMMCAQSMVSMVSAFIPLPGGSGGAEGSFYLLFKLFFDSASIMPAVLLWRVITYYSCILFGGLATAIGNKRNNTKQERQLA